MTKELTPSQVKKQEYNKKYREKKKQELELLKTAQKHTQDVIEEVEDELEVEKVNANDDEKIEKSTGNFFLNRFKHKVMTQMMDMSISIGLPLICKVCYDVASHVLSKQPEPLRVESPQQPSKESMKEPPTRSPELARFSSIPNF